MGATAENRPGRGIRGWTIPSGSLPWLAGVLTLLLKVWLVRAQTLSAVAPAPHDDGLFIHQATAILEGFWLGPYDVLTLAKGPGYPTWLALTSLAGIPLLVAQAILYGVASAVLAVAVRPVLRGSWTAYALFCAVLFNPGSWANQPATRVIRDGFYASVTLLLLAAAIGLALRVGDGLRRSLPWAVTAGLAGGVAAVTREEGIWLLPPVGVVLAIGVARGWRSRPLHLALSGAVALSAFLAPVVAVATANRLEYGVFTTCEMSSSDFQHAYGALTRVKGGAPRRYVPVSREVREQVARVSPAFREIAGNLERRSPNWIAYGCAALGVCDDYAAGWFMWAFRDAVASVGGYRSDGRLAASLYRRIAAEIDEACDAGRLACLGPRSTLRAPWHASFLPPTMSSFARGARFLVTFEEVTPVPFPAVGPDDLLALYAAITHERMVRSPAVSAGGAMDPRLEVLRILTRAYGVALPVLAPVALLLLAWRIVRGPRGDPRRVAAFLALALFVAVAVRLALLALIDATAFPAINVLYMTPAYALLVGAVALVLASELSALQGPRRVPA